MLRDQVIIGTALFVPLALLFFVARSLWMERSERATAAALARQRMGAMQKDSADRAGSRAA